MNEISMQMVVRRSKEHTPSFFGEANYPLRSNYIKKYNYQNLLESIRSWNKYSSIQEECIDKMLELFNIVNENGSIHQIAECTDVVIDNLSKIRNSYDLKSKLRLMKGTDAILNSLDISDKINNIINTHKDICTRFDINKIVNTSSNINDCIYEICSLIDTYNIGLNTKYKICLNECQFALMKNGIEYKDSEIIENVTDYFLCNHMDPNDEQREILYIMENVISENNFIHDTSYLKELKHVSLYEDIIEEDNIFDALDNINESITPKKVKESAIKKFKALPNKTVGSFKNLLQVFLNTNREEDLIDDTPNIMALCFYFFITAGALSINFWAGCIVGIAAVFCRTCVTRKSTEKALKKWHTERTKVKAKLDNEKDPEKQKKLKIYLDGIDKSVEKIENHYDSLKDEEEKESYERRPEDYDGSSKDDDFKTNFNFDSYGEDVNTLNSIVNLMESINWSPDLVNIEWLHNENLKDMKKDEIDFITHFAKSNPDFINNTKLNNVFAECVNSIRNSENPDYEMIAELNKSRFLIEEPSDEYNYDKSLEEIKEELLEIYNGTNILNTYIHEMSIGNIVQIAVDKVKHSLGNLDSAQTTVSNQIDSFARQAERGMTKAVNYGSREAVVKGDILPPLSKCLKLVLGIGGIYFVNPFLALLACISAAFIRSKVLKKEKQLFMDELDVELTMIEKYIKKAEDENNLKRVKQLLLIKKKLQTHYAKMRWSIKMNYNDDDIDAARGAMTHGNE